MQITFVGCNREGNVGRGVLPEVFNPFLCLVEAHLASDIVDTHGCRGITIVNRSDTPVLFLPRCIPDLKFDSLASLGDFNKTTRELRADGGILSLVES